MAAVLQPSWHVVGGIVSAAEAGGERVAAVAGEETEAEKGRER